MQLVRELRSLSTSCLSPHRRDGFSVSVVAEVELLAWLDAQRIFYETLAAGIAEIKPHRTGAVTQAGRQFLVVEAFEEVLHLLEMISLFLLADGLAAALIDHILDGWEYLDLDYVMHVCVGVDRALANIA